jgi:hypothetical protein
MVKNMKVHFIKLLIFSLLVLSSVFQIISCNDPIFFMVHEETKILEPKIDGSPVNFAVLNDKMYTASGKKIFSYSNNNWSKWKDLNGFVIQLAATDNSLYVLYLANNGGGKIRRYFNNGNSSKDINLSDNVQSIYTSGNVLFASVRDKNTYTIYYLDEDIFPISNNMTKIAGTDSESMLNGAASDSSYFYLCTYSGIFCVLQSSPSSALPDVLEPKAGFTGIINLNDNYAAAISKEGKIFEITGADSFEFSNTDFSDKHYTTSALAVWFENKNDTAPSLLLVGKKESSYTTTSGYSNGYVEIELDAAGRIKPNAKFEDPGNGLSSVNSNDRYVSSIGKKPINHIIQTPFNIDDKMTLFASTHQNGVWSYRERDDGWQWNAED